QVNGAWPGGGHADADFSGELSVGARHESGKFLMAGLDEFKPVLRTAHGAHQPIDTVAGVAKNPLHAPLAETLKEKIADRLCHPGVSCLLALERSQTAADTMPAESRILETVVRTRS